MNKLTKRINNIRSSYPQSVIRKMFAARTYEEMFLRTGATAVGLLKVSDADDELPLIWLGMELLTDSPRLDADYKSNWKARKKENGNKDL